MTKIIKKTLECEIFYFILAGLIGWLIFISLKIIDIDNNVAEIANQLKIDQIEVTTNE